MTVRKDAPSISRRAFMAPFPKALIPRPECNSTVAASFQPLDGANGETIEVGGAEIAACSQSSSTRIASDNIPRRLTIGFHGRREDRKVPEIPSKLMHLYLSIAHRRELTA